MKRLVDIALGTIGLIVAVPVIAICAVAIRSSSPGPVFYRAVRVGRNEQRFHQYKLRTMRFGADREGFRTSARDSRITPVGRRLRETSLDELPQLWNVLRGDMSLVGPRPAAVGQLDDYTTEERRARATVRPGLTGLAQVSGRSSLGMREATDLDLWYAAHAGMLVDLRIIARTVVVLLRRVGTN